MTRALLAAAISAALLTLSALTALAAEEVYNERTFEIGRNLSCPVCQGQTVADSHSRVALEMMDAIDAQVEAGRSDDEIYEYFRARYGDEVLVEPPREGINLALWWIPVIGLALGLGAVALYMKDSAALSRLRPQPAEQPGDPELDRLADRVLGEQRDNGALRRDDAQVESP